VFIRSRRGLVLIGLLAAVLAARSDTIPNPDGPLFDGQPVGPLGTSATNPPTRAKDAAPAPGAAPAKPDFKKLGEWFGEGNELMKKKEYVQALEKYEAILLSQPANAPVLYNAACAHALAGDKVKALERLRKSVEEGFVSFVHIARDPDLDSLRGEAAYKKLFARKDEYQEQASERAVRLITENLARQKISTKAYKSVYDGERRFVYLYASSDDAFAQVRRGLDEFADGLWRDLLGNKPEQPLYIVLLATADCSKVMPPGVGGFFNQENNTLFCAERPASRLLQASVVLHEFTHGLHWADQTARMQDHPIWIKEGLSTLFESSRREDGKVIPMPSYRITVIQQAVKAGQSIPWKVLVSLPNAQFVANANLCYAQARCMLYYLNEKGLLKTFYDEYTKAANYGGDRSALEAIEVAFGKPVSEVERDWKAWVLQQPLCVTPFLGVMTEEKNQRLVVKSAVPTSAAAIAGIRKGDVIVSLEGAPIQTKDDLMEAVVHHGVGEEIEIRLERNGAPLDVKAKLGDRPEMTAFAPGAPKPTSEKASYLGLAVVETDKAVRAQDVDPDSPAAKAGIEPGWQILKFDAANIQTVRDYLAAFRKSKPGQTVDLTVRKPDGTEAAVKLEIGTVPPTRDE
jgi:hypothetical protein